LQRLHAWRRSCWHGSALRHQHQAQGERPTFKLARALRDTEVLRRIRRAPDRDALFSVIASAA
jgi:hypothetical protein